MERKVDLSQISDGKRYQINDMAKLGCNGCVGCSKCCQDMGNSIVLDPYDVYRLTKGLSCSFEQLVNTQLELNVFEGIILPNMRMVGTIPQCTFLNDEGRCSIHSVRPGICRIFPLGRVYENGGFDYILQVHECDRNQTKMKIKKWIDTPNIGGNEKFLNTWHYFLKEISARILALSEDVMKQVDLYILTVFFVTPYDEARDFYEQFYERMDRAKPAVEEILSEK